MDDPPTDSQLPVGQEAITSLFDCVAGEPFETVFANPPIELQGHREDSENENTMIRNLDTGEKCPFNSDIVDSSFVGEHTSPNQLSASSVPWQSWWAAKRWRDKEWWCAAESGNLESLRKLLEATNGTVPDVNARSLHNRTALHAVASAGSAESAELLLQARALVDACTDIGLTPLHLASQRGHAKVAGALLEGRADVMQETKDRNLALHFAATNGHADVVRMLLETSNTDQLHVRNALGQKASEVCLDMHTFSVFTECSKTTVSSSFPSAPSVNSEGSEDRYAGRTPFAEGAVLLHNARADAVRRLLQKGKSQVGLSSGMESAISATEEPSGRAPQRKPFVRLRNDGFGVEQVGTDSWSFVAFLGKGSFGEVYQVKHRLTGHEYAMKVLRKRKVVEGKDGILLRYAKTERNVLSFISHPYIVELHYAFQTASHLVLVMQLCTNGNLQAVINKRKHLEESIARLYTAEVLLAFCFLHERDIIYRDLKPDNIVLDCDRHALLTDFGLSKEIAGMQGTQSFCGSPAFMAPEILFKTGHSHTVDVYGLGVLLYTMLDGWPPFHDQDRKRLMANIKFAQLAMPPEFSQEARSFIEQVMHREPFQRLGHRSTDEVKAHAYLKPIDFEALMKREIPVPPFGNSDANPPVVKKRTPESPFAGEKWRQRYSGNQEEHVVSGWDFSKPPAQAVHQQPAVA